MLAYIVEGRGGVIVDSNLYNAISRFAQINGGEFVTAFIPQNIKALSLRHPIDAYFQRPVSTNDSSGAQLVEISGTPTLSTGPRMIFKSQQH